MPDLFEIIETTRAMRRLKPDPVPDELVAQDPAGRRRAPSGGNTQRWRFLVIKDRKIKEAVQIWYKRAFDEVIGPRYLTSAPPPGVTKERFTASMPRVEYLTDHFHEAPVWIVACLEDGRTPNRAAGASIYPAVQNMLLAGARARPRLDADDPAHALREGSGRSPWSARGVHSYAILPIGYPMGKFGPVKRAPLTDVAYQDRWGGPTFRPRVEAEAEAGASAAGDDAVEGLAVAHDDAAAADLDEAGLAPHRELGLTISRETPSVWASSSCDRRMVRVGTVPPPASAASCLASRLETLRNGRSLPPGRWCGAAARTGRR